MLGFGAIPAVSVVYLRRKIRETPRYTLAIKGDAATTAETVRWTTGQMPVIAGSGKSKTTKRTYRARLWQKPFLLRLIGTAGSWFLLDIAFYGNSVSSPLILKALQPHATLLDNILITGGIFLVFAVPGYWLAVGLMDKIGRKVIQRTGFLVMALAFIAIAVIPGVTKNPLLFLLLFGISYFFTEFGPNMTTFVIPGEVFPTSIRGMGDGISAASGKVGAFLGALLVPTLLKTIHLTGVMGIMAAVSLIGILLTIVAIPEPKGLTLEESSAEDSFI